MAKRSYKKVTKKTYKRKSAKRGVRKPAIKRIVRAEIARNVETKSTQQYNTGRIVYPVNHVNFPDNVWELGIGSGMTIVQGTGQGGRIGNSIKTKRLMYRGTFTPLPYSATTNLLPCPAQVKMYIFYDRTDPTAIPSVATNFLQNGGSSRAFSNDLCDLLYPVNTDRYRVLTTRIFKLGYSAYQGDGIDTYAQAFCNNDFKLNCNFSIDLTKYYPQRVKFDDNNGVPTTRGLFCLVVPFKANGGAYTATTQPLGVQFMQDYRYEDA